MMILNGIATKSADDICDTCKSRQCPFENAAAMDTIIITITECCYYEEALP